MTQPAAAVRAARRRSRSEGARPPRRRRVRPEPRWNASGATHELAQGPRDVESRAAATKGGKTRAILARGRGAIVLTVGAFNLAN
jgi:hypothetical protein